jgi:hypothetical protein
MGSADSPPGRDSGRWRLIGGATGKPWRGLWAPRLHRQRSGRSGPSAAGHGRRQGHHRHRHKRRSDARDLGRPRCQWNRDGHRRCRRSDRQFSGPSRETPLRWGAGTAVDSEDTLLFSQLNDPASMNEIFPLGEAQAACVERPK